MPTQIEPTGPLEWLELKPMGGDTLAERCLRRLINDSQLVTDLGSIMLRMRLDDILLWRSDHVRVQELQDFYAQYLYLERLRDSNVLLKAIQEGVGQLLWASEGFAYAQRFNEIESRFEGLVAEQHTSIHADGWPVVGKPDIAQRQMEAERIPEPAETTTAGDAGDMGVNGGFYPPNGGGGSSSVKEVATAKLRYTRFHATVELDDHRHFYTRFDELSREIFEHLAAQPGSQLRITLEVEAELPEDADDALRRTVTENARVLKIRNVEFEQP